MDKAVKMRKNILRMVICVGLLILIWGGYILGTRGIVKVVENDFSWVFQIDSVKLDGTKLKLSGFAFELEMNAEKGRYEILLQDIVSGKNYFANMKYDERSDVSDYFLCEYDYLNSGFAVEFNGEKLSLREKDYEVLLRVRGKRTAYKTGVFISNGELKYANPKEFKDLDVAGTNLEEIVEEGVLRVYRPDYGMYVFQYEGELYWIAEDDYEFRSNDTYVQYQLYTTQVEKLPQKRQNRGWYWDNLNFYFTKNEMTEWNTGKYRVTRSTLPIEYSVTKIMTGNNLENEWVWKQYFYPWYEFQ